MERDVKCYCSKSDYTDGEEPAGIVFMSACWSWFICAVHNCYPSASEAADDMLIECNEEVKACADCKEDECGFVMATFGLW